MKEMKNGAQQRPAPEVRGSMTAGAGAIAGQLTRIADALEALAREAKEGKENLPPTPPIREREEGQQKPTHARTREESPLTCEGFLVPTPDEVKVFAAANGIAAAIAEEFWNYYDGMGWQSKGSPVRKWRPLLKAWQNAHRRFDRRDADRIAHIDAKMDEREKKRERRTGGRRKADNNVEMSDEVREEVRRDFAI